VTLARLLIAINASTRGFQRGLGGAGRSIESLEKKTGRMSRGFGNATSGLASFAKRALFVGAVALVALSGGIGLVTQKAIAWEDAFAGVRKTVDATDAELDTLGRGIRDLSLTIPIASTELAGLAETAGALGVAKGDILEFVRVTALIGVTTNVSSAAAADALGRLSNILHLTSKDYSRFASALVALGNAGASTEAEILEITKRMGAAGKLAGLTTPQIIGWASALASVSGMEPERAGTSMQMFLISVTKFATKAGRKLNLLAKTAGTSSKAFKNLFAKDANAALLKFIKGLGKLDKAQRLAVLSQLGFNEAGLTRALLGLADSYGEVERQVDLSTDAWQRNTAMTAEAEKRFATTKSQLAILGNILSDLAVTLGMAVLPVLISLIKPLGEWLKANQALIEQLAGKLATGIQMVIGFIGEVITAVVGWVNANRPLIEQIGTFLVNAVTSAWTFITTQLIPALMSIAAWLGDNVIPKVQAFVATMTGPGGVVDSVGGVVGKILDDLIPVFSQIFDALFGNDGLIPAFGRLVGILWGDGKGALASVVSAVGFAFSNILGPGLWGVIEALKALIGWVSAALTELDKLGKKIDGLLPKLHLNPFEAPPLWDQFPHGAKGLTNFPGGMALVGEKGPEIVNLPRGSDVIPNDESFGGHGGETHITINNPEPRASDRDIGRVMRRLEGLGLVATRRAGAPA
jgi:TP901 family phage tail tape measure protein